MEQSLYWWIDHVSTIASVPLALIGFGVTLWQLTRTKRAADSARVAVEHTQKQIKTLSVVAKLPELHRIDEELHRAIEKESVELTQFWVTAWQREAGAARGYLAGGPDDKLMAALQSSITAASTARGEMLGIEPAEIRSLTATLRKRIIAVTSQLGEMAAKKGTTAPDQENDD